jgi:hypothetical protein
MPSIWGASLAWEVAIDLLAHAKGQSQTNHADTHVRYL